MGLSKRERELGYKQAPAPTPHNAAILRRIARGFLLVTKHEGRDDSYSYDDGTAPRTVKGGPWEPHHFNQFRRNGWIVPIDNESLLGDPLDAQRWRARTLDDGPLPRFTGGPRTPE